MKQVLALSLLFTTACASMPYHVTVLTTSGGTLYRGSQPLSQEALAGVGMNPLGLDYRLSNDGEGGISYETERGWNTVLGLQFIPDPSVAYPFPTEKSLRVIASKINIALTSGFDIFIHCKRGKDRTGGVVAAYEILYTQRPLDQILKDRASYLSAIDEIVDAEETVLLLELAHSVGK